MADLVVSLIEVAVTVAVNALVTETGVLYWAEVVVGLVSVPCEPLVPEMPHVTPAFFGSFATVAAIGTVWA